MKKSLFLVGIMLILAGLCFAEEDKEDKLELSFIIGGAFTQLNSSSNYANSCDSLLGTSFNESATVTLASKNSVFYSGSFAYYFLQNSVDVGIQAGFGYLKSDAPGDTSSNINWIWSDGTGSSGSYEGEVFGDFKVVPININGIMKFKDDKFNGYLSGGYTLFKNKFNANSNIFVGATIWTPELSYYLLQWFGGAEVPTAISESWTGHGINIGGGIYYKQTEIIGITADIRYYHCPSRDMRWSWPTGTYAMANRSWITLDIDSETAAFYENATTGITVNPSFFVISVGFKVFIK